MNKIKQAIAKAFEKVKDFDSLISSIKESEHILLKSLSPDDAKLAPSFEVTSVPNTFVKTFVYDYAEDLDYMVNHYAEKNELEIISISICHTDVFVASVVFERGFEI